MDGDEVIVEILANDDHVEGSVPTKDASHVYGKVVNIDKRAIDYTDKILVCLADPYSDNLMSPVNRRLPKMMILHPDGNRNTRKGKQSPGHLVIPICRLTKHGLKKLRDVVVSNKVRPHKLFKVQWRYWKKEHYYPICVVIEELPAGDTMPNGLEILRQTYEVQPQQDTYEIQTKYPLGWSIPQEEYYNRIVIQDQIVFTIDPPGSEDLDDALSVQKVSDDRYVVGVHIADVSYFVKCGTEVDDTARQAATSFYPASDKPIHMLPPRLSTDLCSLKPGQDKLTISVFLQFDKDESGSFILSGTNIVRSIVQSQFQLTYDDADKIITDTCYDYLGSELKESLYALSCLACCCRLARLGKAAFSHGSLDTLSHPLAHISVEEMMIIANETVAIHLLSKFPQCTPLRRQLPAPVAQFRRWKEDNYPFVEQSSELIHRTEIIQSILDDSVQCEEEGNQLLTMNITQDTWNQIRQCVTDEGIDIFRLGALFCTDLYHPQLSAVQSALHQILPKGEYINSGDYPREKHIHSSLAKNPYTHFTSPIRRYIDIVVHRLLVADLNRTGKIPHDRKDVTQLCHKCNVRSFAARQFQVKTHALRIALCLKQHPLQIHGFIEVLTERNVQLGFKHDGRVCEGLKRANIGFNALKPFVKPELEDEKVAVMKWKERVYHVRGMPHLKPHDILANQSRRVNLQVDNNSRVLIQVPAQNWQCINDAIQKMDWKEAGRQILAAESIIQSLNATRYTMESEELSGDTVVEDVTCETTDDTRKKKHYVQFEHALKIGNVAKVQLYPTFIHGILQPNVQLYQMTPTLDFCIEHRSHPVKCLSSVADDIPDRKDIKTYQETWLPLIDMIAAYNAVQQNETVVVHGVKIQWQQHSPESLPAGSFTLKKKFCKERHIEISHVKASGRKQAYLCIRHTSKQTAQSDKHNREPDQPMTFVAHAWTLDVESTDEKDPDKVELNIFFEVNQMSAPFPRVLRETGREPEECTVEVIPVCYPDSRLEGAVKEVDSSSSLVKNVCLLTPNKATFNQDTEYTDMKILASGVDATQFFNVPGCKLNRLNPPQAKAVRNALRQRFAVIQGPPGTGKTVTGAYLVYFFTEQNKLLPNRGKGRPQILYCGPSNKSVDVIAEYLKCFKISIVRVYGNEIESREYPIPGLPQMAGKMGSRNVATDPRHKTISLHHLIRMRNRSDGLTPNSRCDAILGYDKRFRTPGYEPHDREVAAYHKTIFEAELEELKKYHVILTTCNAAGSDRIKIPTNIVQCIVDEAGMCNEPETLIPLVTTKPLQIVLIGDHKQLRPVIPEPTAKQLGMETSLLQRYAKQMNMLTIQYRMHDAICKFPSMAFYDNRLVTPEVVKKRSSMLLRGVWPGDGSRPIAFCHCTGAEETLSVKTAEGNEMSKANLYEVEQVVRMVNVLVDNYKVNASEIVVLSQYRLQCDKISTALKDCGKSDVNVRTVTQSQGSEWNYVLLSTVRSLPRVEIEERPNFGWRKRFLGFITDENQTNVALTRAKHGLVIVGNKYLLRSDKLWKKLLDHYDEVGCLVDAKGFLRQRKRQPRNRRNNHFFRT